MTTTEAIPCPDCKRPTGREVSELSLSDEGVASLNFTYTCSTCGMTLAYSVEHTTPLR